MKNPQAVFTFNDGRTMTFDLYPEKAKNTVNNFIDLAESGFYDGLKIHRIVKGYVIQGGSPKGVCMCPSEFSIKGEFAENGVPENDIKHVRGALSMARGDNPDSAGTQYFVVHRDAAKLDGRYAAFGMMTEGFDLLEELASLPTDETPGLFNPPFDPPVVKTVAIIRNDYTPEKPERIYDQGN